MGEAGRPVVPGARGYQPEGELGGFEQEVERLEHQAALTWAHEWRVLRPLAPSHGGAVLDAGCGNGAVTAAIRDELPGTRVVGLDTHPGLLDRARARGAAGRGAELFLGDIGDTPFADATFDLVLSRYVFQHLPEPVAVARELLRILRPGGYLAVVDVDAGLWGAAEPDLSGLSREAYRAFGAAQSADGGDRLIARRLPRVLREAGCTDVTVRPFAYTSDEVGLAALAPQLSPERLLPLVERGAIGMTAYVRAMSAWQSFVASDGFVLLLGFAVVGRR
ncbi:methyltransferase domain-containing protein [Streptomyces sp. SL13]|uniref:Methyltransferase domain-containing protein n=1 Tax=Streptantibioticus silvisoli TaxID=2705255 RepID=A0AA90KBN1_9ACTN|nr:methyltransferase domain-containing protein [Streptantibioticus silvisoli]MDI5973542.1 methyltransferase domain-containing protein [Streptantibioticus silvisoli]